MRPRTSPRTRITEPLGSRPKSEHHPAVGDDDVVSDTQADV